MKFDVILPKDTASGPCEGALTATDLCPGCNCRDAPPAAEHYDREGGVLEDGEWRELTSQAEGERVLAGVRDLPGHVACVPRNSDSHLRGASPE